MYNINFYNRLLLIMLNVFGPVCLNAHVTIDRNIVQFELGKLANLNKLNFRPGPK